jgi:hypothetical protein
MSRYIAINAASGRDDRSIFEIGNQIVIVSRERPGTTHNGQSQNVVIVGNA